MVVLGLNSVLVPSSVGVSAAQHCMDSEQIYAALFCFQSSTRVLIVASYLRADLTN